MVHIRATRLLLFVLRSMARTPRRTIIAVGAIALGVVALMTAAGFIESLLLHLREDTIYAQLGHIRIERPQYAERGLADAYQHLLHDRPEEIESIQRIAGVRAIAPRLNLAGLISKADRTLSFIGYAVDPAKDREFARALPIVDGEALRVDDRNTVLLGSGLAASLGAKPGDQLVLLVSTPSGGINAVDVQVRGIFKATAKPYDDTGIRLPLATAEQLLRVRGAQQWLVLLQDTDDTAAAADALRRVLPASEFVITEWSQDADFYHKTRELFARQLGFMRVVVLAIVVLGILNTMTMNVMERTWEVGVMLALGDSRRQVLALFAVEGALLGIVGAASGAVLGVAVAQLVSAIGIPMPAPPGMSRGFDVGIVLSLPLVLGSAAIGCVAAACAGIGPSLRASRLPIIEALRSIR